MNRNKEVQLDKQCITIEVEEAETIAELKRQILQKFRIPLHQQRLIFDGRPLEDDKTIGDYHINKQSKLHLVVKMKKPKSNNNNNSQ